APSNEAPSNEAPTRDAAARRARAVVEAEPGTELARLLDIRIPDLVEYQNERYAREYAEFVEQVRSREGAAGPVSEAVARNLYKLMAYKDEYEVARLSIDPRLLAEIEARFGEGSRYAYRLHPPVLRALGLDRKISLGPWFRPVFRMLRASRKLRGTRFDPFGYAKVRRIERALIGEYRDAIRCALDTVPADHPMVLELAELPDVVRGYEDVKLANVTAYRQRQEELLGSLARPYASGLAGQAAGSD
ncbi:MAG: 2-oxoacid ferredoxin oxidoreductase, partial [Pseudonocardiaceae bacterium]|nr:2-oxoacid ferredoxin oxidoreductase [Pseudonocardiaceae bacterium]